MDRNNHYEAAFEAYLRHNRLTTVAVDESRRSTLDDEPIKSLDFIVYGSADARLLIDVKGRKFPGGDSRKESIRLAKLVAARGYRRAVALETAFGRGYRTLLLFMYDLLPMVELPLGTRRSVDLARPSLSAARRGRSGLSTLDAQVRSPRWRTVHLPQAAFRQVVRPFSEFLH